MALDPRYITTADLEEFFVDKDSALPLANGVLRFYRDVARTVPKEVFQLTGSPPNYTYVSMGAEITLSAVGTVQNASGDNVIIYYFPFDGDGNEDLYYITCENENGVQQFTREGWPNEASSGNDPASVSSPNQNQITNPTFTNIFLNEGIASTLTVTSASNEEIPIGPDWTFVINGTGTIIVQRIDVTGNDKIVTSPPYFLDIQVSTGITSCFLRQRFEYNSGLWTSTPNVPIYLNGSFVARNETGGTSGIQMYYLEPGQTPILILNGSFQTDYVRLTGSTASAIPQSSNTNSGELGYVDIYLALPTSSHIRVTSVELFPSINGILNAVPYDLNSSNRNEVFKSDYYTPRLIAKTMSSYLTAWDFSTNPYQFGLASLTTTAVYIADQTIGKCGTTGNVATTNTVNTGGIQFTTAGTNDSFYIMQYLSGGTVRDMIGKRLSCNVFGYQTNTGSAVNMRVYLLRGNAASTFPTLPAVLGTVSITGEFTIDPTLTNWSVIPRSNLNVAQAVINPITANTSISSTDNDYGFNGWEITDTGQIDDTNKFAIIVTFGYVETSTVVVVNSISLVPGDLPCRPSSQNPGDVLRECEYYYEKSFPGSTPTAVLIVGGIYVSANKILTSGTLNVYPTSFSINFKTPKFKVPTMTFYDPVQVPPTAGRIGAFINPPNGSFSLVSNNFAVSGNLGLTTVTTYQANLSAVSTNVIITTTGCDANTEGYMMYIYTADARIGK